MPVLVSLPRVADLMQPFLMRTYDAQIGCWLFVRDLLSAGGFIAADTTQRDLIPHLAEVWVRGDAGDVLTLTQPWDLWLMHRGTSRVVTHVGLVADQERLAHQVGTAGPCLELLRRRRPVLFQVARLRELL